MWLQANDPATTASQRRNAAGGEITFGGANLARYKEPITYVNCVGDTPWMVLQPRLAMLNMSWLFAAYVIANYNNVVFIRGK